MFLIKEKKFKYFLYWVSHCSVIYIYIINIERKKDSLRFKSLFSVKHYMSRIIPLFSARLWMKLKSGGFFSGSSCVFYVGWQYYIYIYIIFRSLVISLIVTWQVSIMVLILVGSSEHVTHVKLSTLVLTPPPFLFVKTIEKVITLLYCVFIFLSGSFEDMGIFHVFYLSICYGWI